LVRDGSYSTHHTVLRVKRNVVRSENSYPAHHGSSRSAIAGDSREFGC